MRGQASGALAAPASRALSVNVLPVLALHPVGEEKQHDEIEKDDEADPRTLVLGGLGHVIEEIDEIAHDALVLERAKLPRRVLDDGLHDVRMILARAEHDDAL